ncbi:uncharacterized protein LY89DRAFT_780599 [Mollisia scopiformis]|uniref:Uncharacterized protein n=1 Tax=Mollisia scopiformis TaxID=149040 RepID=A0A194XEH4_MOLSC|nr:uncharacterized protein LY89DRAFT_780599 [Mollisia scopiformis]KUJ18546.1 hypothetical protein LY89DRAFT_780599 [Mollisia scopiformis]
MTYGDMKDDKSFPSLNSDLDLNNLFTANSTILPSKTSHKLPRNTQNKIYSMASIKSPKDTGQEPNLQTMNTNTNNPPPESEANGQTEVERDKLDDEKSSSEQLMPARIPYNNGYGDFCFGRWALRRRVCDWTGTVQDQEFWEKGSNGVVVPELDGFKRDGPFPFFSLPLLVRDMIYRLLLGPLYEYDENDKTSYIRLYVEQPEKSHADRYEHGYEHFIGMERKASAVELDDPNSSTKPETTIEEYEQQLIVHRHKYAVHPSRSTSYQIGLFPTWQGGSLKEERTDSWYLEWLRKLSNVSNKFRHELGHVFWTRIAIDASLPTMRGPYSVLQLLHDRSSIHAGIKDITVKVDLEAETQGLVMTAALVNFKELCDFIGDRLVLETFCVQLEMEEDSLSDIFRSEYLMDYLQPGRQLQVRKRFSVQSAIYLNNNHKSHSSEEWDDFTENLRMKYEKFITDVMLPDTLRWKPATDEMNVYLQSRSDSLVVPPSSLP